MEYDDFVTEKLFLFLFGNNLLLKHKGSFQLGESPEVQVSTAVTHKKFDSAKY